MEKIKNYLSNCINVSILFIIISGIIIFFSVISLFSHPINILLTMLFRLFSPILLLLLFKFILKKFNKPFFYIVINSLTIILTIVCIHTNWHNYLAYTSFINYKYLTPDQKEIVIKELTNFYNGENIVKFPQKNN